LASATAKRSAAPATARPRNCVSKHAGGQKDLIWLLNGRQIGRLPADRALQQEFGEVGRYQITVMDDAGRYDRVEISVR
jgi:membrane carboxypeptidase/penicillin-binding protein PbpC